MLAAVSHSAVALLLALASLPTVPQPGAGAAGEPPVLRPLPRPDLSRVEPVLATQIEGLAELVRTQEAQGLPPEPRAESWGTLGHLYFYYGFLDAAADAYANAGALAPADPRWPYHRGVVASDRGEPARALEHFDSVLERMAGNPPALVRSGRAALELDQPRIAAARFARATELVPDWAAAWEGLGRARLRLGELDEAVEALQRAVELQPRATTIHMPLAQALRRRGAPGDLDAARAHLDRWGDVKVTMPDPYMDRMGQATALSSYGLVHGLAPRRSEFPDLKYFRFALGTLEGVRGAAERLSQDLQSWPAERRDADAVARARLHYVLGGVAGSAGRAEDAANHYATALELLPDLHHARAERAAELVRLGRRDEALAELERLFGATLSDTEIRDPSFVEARLLWAKLLVRDAPARAREQFDRVTELRPDGPEPWLGAAAARLLTGDRPGAEETLQRGLRTVTDPAGRDALESVLRRWRDASPEASVEALLEGVL